MEKLCILMPAYNEEENIEKAIRDWYPIIEGKDEGSALVINYSGSSDGTEARILSLKGEYPALETIQDSDNTYGAKVLDLYRYAVNNDFDYAFQTDSDGQTDPAEFEDFWTLRKDYDAIIGNRIKRQDGWSRKAVQLVECGLIGVFFRVRVPDANTPFRLFNRALLEKYLDIIPADYSMPNLIMTACIAANGEKIRFVPISFGARQGGVNKMNLKKICMCGIESIKTFKTTARELRRRKKYIR